MVKGKQQQQQQPPPGSGLNSPAASGGAARLPLSPHKGLSAASVSDLQLGAKAEAQGLGTGGAGNRKTGAQGTAFEGDVLREVRRLLAEKAELLASGLYIREDVVIQQLDRRVQQLAEAQ